MKKVEALIKKRAELEKLIAQARRTEKRKSQVAELIAGIEGAMDLDDEAIKSAITAAVSRAAGAGAAESQL